MSWRNENKLLAKQNKILLFFLFWATALNSLKWYRFFANSSPTKAFYQILGFEIYEWGYQGLLMLISLFLLCVTLFIKRILMLKRLLKTKINYLLAFLIILMVFMFRMDIFYF
ncbi:hypothetical protein ACFLZP_01255 [Patescibacteria group bacterium]